ncbi:CRISPR-associated endonuclease Cas2 [Candidatus Adlerbacteria bacterium RIFCSPHIGHO2_02_FULL_54_18]|uniref:CRISPR-associated endonuclease Cas2 n=2 Tax=Candidatus Adleribacteriota TaxID=1752736 RepID=A0A1F4Y354_9BACT|nr:MAG: CRISPR-associated endonuclease Cas2 [Candidatus Adlerbacteria bacterium RIFCSPLOWO2_01_FULL_54_21b]OGC88382.1 MAG: CRISPR-associated endonuclease Cas2 [Candidatus Adlerbacteria bacterium RIFCSPHIGHO2_02_FULL_54_18]
MGEIETRVKARIRKTKINKAVITILAVAGGLAVALVAPNVLGALGKLGLINPRQKRQGVEKSFSRLIRYGYIILEDGNSGKCARLTEKGERYAAMFGEGKLVPKKPRRWDKKWRMLMFDIPERRRAVRSQIRASLINMGFYRLQDSVWVYPYDAEDLITLLKADFKIGKDVLYVVADAIEYDLPLRKHFGLE